MMETGTPGRKGTPAGWLNRVCGLLGHEATPFRAVAMTPALPRSLYGGEPALAVTDLADFAVRAPGAPAAVDPREAAGARAPATAGFEALYEETSERLLRDAGGETFEAIELLAAKRVAGYRPAAGADYPADPSAGRSARSSSSSRPTSASRSPSPRAAAGTPTSSRAPPAAPSPAAPTTSPARSPPSGPTSAPARATWS
jgi:hypothetical protein